MEERDAETYDGWKRQGCSLLWDDRLLAGILQKQAPVPLRDAMIWRLQGWPGGRPPRLIFVEGVYTYLQLLGNKVESEGFLEEVVRPLISHWKHNWVGTALIFALHCDRAQWNFTVEGYATLTLDQQVLDFTQKIWSAAGRSPDRLMVTPQPLVQKAGQTQAPVLGGLYVSGV